MSFWSLGFNKLALIQSNENIDDVSEHETLSPTLTFANKNERSNSNVSSYNKPRNERMTSITFTYEDSLSFNDDFKAKVNREIDALCSDDETSNENNNKNNKNSGLVMEMKLKDHNIIKRSNKIRPVTPYLNDNIMYTKDVITKKTKHKYSMSTTCNLDDYLTDKIITIKPLNNEDSISMSMSSANVNKSANNDTNTQSNDIKSKKKSKLSSQKIWNKCCVDSNENIAFYANIYPKLCQLFKEKTKCNRYPLKDDLLHYFMKYGAYLKIFKNIIDLGKNNRQPGIYRKNFYKFYKFFINICDIIQDLSFLWDKTKHNHIQTNFFYTKEKCEELLKYCNHGTFIIRISYKAKHLIITYVKSGYTHSKYAHIIIYRDKANKYCIQKNNKKKRYTTFNTIIRNYTNIKYLYTQQKIYTKQRIF